ncbi:MAG: aminotransferase class III-fold pyridoxal phosphate-dependent enzyme [Patulibacter minatonensis]
MSDGALSLPDQTHAPRFTVAQAEALVAEHWGLAGASATELGSYQDQVFRIDPSDGARVALKIAGAQVERAVLELEHAVLRTLDDPEERPLGALRTPLPIVTLAGEEIVAVGAFHARVLTWAPGDALAGGGFVDDARARALGDAAGRLSAALAGIDHPAARRVFQWDVRHAAAVAELARDHLTDDEWAMQRRALAWLAGVDDGALPRQLAYTDLTANNLLGAFAADGTFTPTAIVDFGDLVHTWRIADVASAAYAAIAGDPARALELTAHVVAAFHDRQALEPAEADALWPVIAGRAALCGASLAHQVRSVAGSSEASAAYLDTFVARDDAALRAALAVDPIVARAVIRDACGLAVCPVGAQSDAQLAALDPGPLLDGIDRAALMPVDLGVGTSLLTERAWDDADAIAAALAGAVPDGAYAVGRWGEARLPGAGRPLQDPRPALHLGADLFVPPGTTVLAPYDVRVIADDGHGAIELESLGPGRAPILRLSGLEPLVGIDDEPRRGARLGTVAARAVAAEQAPLPAHLHVQLATTSGLPAAGDAALRAAWTALCPDPSPLLGVDVSAPPTPTAAELVGRRERVVATPQHLYYREPTPMVRGWGAWIYDGDARPLLDMVNNVAVLGHAHPAVTAAATEQFALLNTNSRFLYAAMAEYAEAIAATLPPHLSSIFFVNSGSEALDLAIRLARVATGRHDLLAIEGAYHGWTGAVFELCTHPQDNPGWRGNLPASTHVIPQPHPLRGALGPDAEPYVDAVRAACAAASARGGGPAAFVAEPMLGNAGAVSPPPGFMAAAYEVVRAHGGLNVADEVQVGYGRTGETFWAFEREGLEPDVVAAAKAVGNGHPLGFVACRPELAAAFDAHAPWFSSPGGGPVSCRVGLAVLRAIQSEGLQENAAIVGAHLKARLEALAADHPIIGQVHGRGLYLGVDLVRDRATAEPAAGEARAICERLRRFGVILQPTGDHDNVLKVKPPLCLTIDDADFAVDALERVLVERASTL